MVDAAAIVEDKDDGACVVGGRDSEVGPFCEEQSFSGASSVKSPEVSLLEVARFLKFRNRESQFLLPVRKMRNLESENNSFSIPFTVSFIPIPVPIPPKYPTEPELRFLGI